MTEEMTYSLDSADIKKDRIFELDLYEMILFDQYETQKAELEVTTERIQDIRTLRKAKLMIDSGRITVLGEDNPNNSEVLNAMEEYYN